MISKWLPALLTTASMGGVAYYVTNFVESEILVKSIVSNSISDLNWLRDRNPKAFQIKNPNTVGSAWNTWSEGNTYKDETYYVFDDWSWLDGVKIGSAKGQEFSNGSKLKSYINGVGLKVEKITDKDEWKNNEWEKKRDMKVRRVLMSNDEGYWFGGGYKVFNKGSCFLKTTNTKATSASGLYLMLGFAKGFEEELAENGTRPEKFGFVEGYKSFCNWYANGHYESQKSEINLSFKLEDGKTITGREYPTISNKDFAPIYFQIEGEKVNVVVLGVAIKGQMVDKDGERAGKHLTKEEATKEIRSKINSGIIGIFPKSSGKHKMVGLKIKNGDNGGSTTLSGDSTDSWISNVSVTYKY